MTAVVALNTGIAKSGIGKNGPEKAKDGPVTHRVISAIRDLWPRKTAQHLAYVTGHEERTVKHWLAGETRMSVDAVAALLRTDEGFKILTAVMGDAKPVWWLDAQISQQARQARLALKREQKRTEELRAQRSLLEEI